LLIKIYWFLFLFLFHTKVLSEITSKTYSIAISITYYQWNILCQ
jgi:hypothetical protein